MSFSEWFEIKTIAECPPFNGVRRTAMRFVNRENCQCRPRQGKGGGREYHISSLPKETQRALRIRQTKQQQAASRQSGDLNEAQLKGNLEGMKEAGDNKDQHVRQMAAFNQLSPKEQGRVRARIEVLSALEVYVADFESLEASIREFVDAYNSNQLELAALVKSYVPKVSRANLYRWRAAYATEGPAGLACNYKAVKRSLMDTQPELTAFAEGMLAKMPHTSAPNMLKALGANFDGRDDLTIPSERALQQWLAKWKVKNKRLFTAVANPDAFKNKYMAAGGDAAENVLRLNQLWEMDSSPADVMCTDGRFSLIACLDVYSRRAVLKVRKSSDSWGVALTMREAILQWAMDGQGEQVIRVDNGKDYASHYMAMVADVLGIDLKFTDPFSGEQKPFVERFFRTFAHGMVEMLPGFIGHNVAEREAIKAQFSFADRLKRKAGSSKNVIDVTMSSEDLQTFCNRWIDAFYMHDAHGGLNGQSPAERVANWVEPLRRIDDVRALDLLLEPIPGQKGIRTAQKKGIRLEGGWYVAAELGARVGEQFMVRYDNSDIGRIYLFETSGEFVCMAQNPAITGISREELARAMKEEQKKIGQQKAELKAKGRKINQADLIEKIFAKREREIAERNVNVTQMPRRHHEHQTDYLAGAADALAAADQAKAEEQAKAEREANPSAETLVAWSDYMKDANQSTQNKQEGNQQAETGYDRMRRWIRLEERQQAGEALSEFEQNWKQRHEGTAEFQGHKMVLDDFGKTAFGLKDE
ncbi:Mu transposase C-terminal domain-containing protein [uncultured Endozoicomonas sp.]|uniref:Mu transposase C-terminal domain-containing protein n=1 Tax=uncultured Endozoicomonas sp. TaxID=432652 RepID=UPI00262589CA|nr:Mu transposase C-terminal domain-containing protein [uncultured Endozoicomonas sp.]